MSDDQNLESYADPSFEQFFLVSDEKISLLLAAADIRATDRVVELGAGAGTVARHIPKCRSLTAIELDPRLIGPLSQNAPAADVINGDGLELASSLEFDVLISNMPNYISENLLSILPTLNFRTAVAVIGTDFNLDTIDPGLTWTEVTRITGDDFRPPQGSVSRVIQIQHSRSSD